MPRLPKPPGTRMPSKPVELGLVAAVVWVFGLEAFGFDPGDVELEVVGEGGVDEGFLERLVGVLVLDVLADDGDGDLVAGVVGAVDEVLPLGSGRRLWRRCGDT